MRGRGWALRALRFLRGVALADLGILLAVGAACWLGGRRSAEAYGTAMIWAGVGVIIVGLILPYGHLNPAWSSSPQMGQTVGAEAYAERTRRVMAELGRSYAILPRTAAIGMVAMALGALIRGG